MERTEQYHTIMIVDDAPANLKLLTNMLHSRGYRVMAFPGGQSALAAAEAQPPDLILLDITMPEMDGFEVCTRLKKSATLKEIPVIFISALTETEDKVNALAAGGVDYVSKPFQFEEVLARIETHLELRRREIALEEANQRLLDLEQLRDNLVHMIVHDMRGLLTGLVGYLELSTLDGSQEEKAGHIAVAMDSANLLIGMVNDLLDVHRMEAKQMPLHPASTDMNDLIARSIE